MKTGILLGCVAMVMACSDTQAAPVKLALQQGTVRFLAIGKPSAIRIRGTGEAPKGSVTIDGAQVTGEFQAALDTLDTGISLRTQHMKEKYLETGKFPRATFKITGMKLPSPLTFDSYSAEEVPVSGILSLHGIEKPVSGKAKVSSKAGVISASVSFPATVSAHGIAIPVYLGITMADQVEIDVDVSGKLEI